MMSLTLLDFSVVITCRPRRTVAIMQKIDANSTRAIAVSRARTLLRRRFFSDSRKSFMSTRAFRPTGGGPRALAKFDPYATLENTSDTLTARAFHAGTMPPRNAAAAPSDGPHQNTCAGTKKIGKKAN